MPLDSFLRRYVKDIIYKTPVTCFDEMKLRIATAIETINTAGEPLEEN
jgi:hypothetical protein